MIELARTVRFFLNGLDPRAAYEQAARVNGFAAWPPPRGLGRFYQLQVVCKGEVDAVTGYFVNIKEIDAAVRRHVLPYLEESLDTTRPSATIPMGELMRKIIALLEEPLGKSVAEVRLELSPFHRIDIRSADMDQVIIRQQFEFAAAHRLHVDALSPERNRQVFGKCNNPSGHGHNYRLEVAVRAPIDADGRVLLVESLDELVDREVIQKLDHKHLNLDVPEFAQRNPSCENIAAVVHGMLKAKVKDLGVELEEVSVWETGKTVCVYREE